jgi:hypothetical protein
MNHDLTIQIPRLRRAFELIADHLAESEGTALSLGNDYFWAIPADELYNVYSRPTEMSIGQLSESWQHIEDVIDGKTDIVTYHLIWLSDVLRAVAQEADAGSS